MAINPSTLYPGQIASPTVPYPYGSARNITIPGDGTGTPWEAALVNDLFGMWQALLSNAGVTPTGTPDSVSASQYLEALVKIHGAKKATVAAMVADTTLVEGQEVRTGGYDSFDYLTLAPKGSARYLITTQAKVRAVNGDVTWTPDGYVDHTLSSGLVAVFLPDGHSISVSQAGAKGDKTTDDHPAIQAAVDWLKAYIKATGIGQGEIIFPETDSDKYYKVTDQILFQDMIQIKINGGQGAHIRNDTTDKPVIHIEGTGGFGNVFGFQLLNVFLSQNYASATEPALRLTRCILSWLGGGYIDNNAAGSSYGIYMDSSSAENFVVNWIIENAGVDGVYCASDLNHFVGVHALGCGRYGMQLTSTARGNVGTGLILYGNGEHGLYDIGQNNNTGGIVARNNSQSSAGTYSGVYKGGTDNIVGDCMAYDDQGGPTQGWGVTLAGTRCKAMSNLAGQGNVNGLIQDTGTDNRFHGDGTTLGKYDGFIHNGPIIHKNSAFFTSGDTTPDVSGGNKFRTNNGAATSITTFDGGTNGQTVRVLILDNNTTFVHSASFDLQGSANITPSAGDWMEFELVGATWYGWKLNF